MNAQYYVGKRLPYSEKNSHKRKYLLTFLFLPPKVLSDESGADIVIGT